MNKSELTKLLGIVSDFMEAEIRVGDYNSSQSPVEIVDEIAKKVRQCHIATSTEDERFLDGINSEEVKS